MKARSLSLPLALLFGVLLGAALPATPLWFAIPPLFVAFIALAAAGERVRDHGFLVLCTGELLVAAAGTGLPWSVLPLQCVLVAVILAELGLFSTVQDLLWFAAYALTACGAFALVLLTGNVLLSGLIALVFFGCMYLGIRVGEHEQERVLAGVSP